MRQGDEPFYMEQGESPNRRKMASDIRRNNPTMSESPDIRQQTQPLYAVASQSLEEDQYSAEEGEQSPDPRLPIMSRNSQMPQYPHTMSNRPGSSYHQQQPHSSHHQPSTAYNPASSGGGGYYQQHPDQEDLLGD
jgi:hypothetical protein